MCEQTEVQYLPNDVVWVKLRQPSLWWPGQVQDFDALPEEVQEGLRKKPLAVVKFFQEDAYEYVNNLNNIYHYNCSRKHDFIKKGLELARSKRPERPAHMDLFPQDVASAESLTNGDPDIIRDDAFAPEEKPSYGGLFGNEKKKNLKKTKSIIEPILKDRPAWRVKPFITKQSPTTPRTPSSPKPSKVITHRRFINKALSGESDYKIYIREQPVVEDETASPSSEYRCHSCDFVTARLNVIVLHYRSHSKSVTPIPKVKPPKVKSIKSSSGKPKTEKKSETPAKVTSVEPLKKRNILKESSPDPPEKSEKISPKKSPKEWTPKPQAPKRKVKAEARAENEGKKAKKEEIQELLKDWSDDEADGESQTQKESDGEESKPDDKEAESSEIKMDVDEEVKEVETEVESKKSKPKETVSPPAPVPKSKAVFDFDDSDDGLDPKLTHNTRVFGRKIPRVIDNVKERRSSLPEAGESSTKSDPKEIRKEGSEAKRKRESTTGTKKSPKVAVETVEQMDVSAIVDKKDLEDIAKREKEVAAMSAEIDSLLEKTSVPDLPEIPKFTNFSLESTEDFPLSPGKSKESEDPKDSKDKSILREHNDITSNNLKDGAEVSAPSEDPSKNSLPEVGSAVEKISTPPQADCVKNTAEIPLSKLEKPVTKTEKVTKAVIQSIVLTAPQSTSGGDHSYVSDKSPPKMPPLTRTSQPSKQVAKSPQTFVLSRQAPVKSVALRHPDESKVVRVVSAAPTTTKTSKPVPSLVNKDGKYVIVRSTAPTEQKLVPVSLAASPKSGSAQLLTSPKTSLAQATVTPPKPQKLGFLEGLDIITRPKVDMSHTKVPCPKSGKMSMTLPKMMVKVDPPKKNVAQTPVSSPNIVMEQGGKKLVILTKKASGDFVLAPQKKANILSKPASKDVSTSKAASPVVNTSSPQKAVETKTVVQASSMLAGKKNILLSSPGGVRDTKTILVPVSNVGCSKPPTLLTTRGPGGSKSFIIPQNMKLVSSKDSSGKMVLQMESQKTKVTLPSMQRTGGPLKIVRNTQVVQAGPSQKLSSATTSQQSSSSAKPSKPNKFFNRDTPSSTATASKTIVQTIGKQPTKKTVIPISKVEAPTIKSPVTTVSYMQSKPSILKSSPRTSVKRNFASKTTSPAIKESSTVKGTKSEAVVSSGTVLTDATSSSVTSTPVEGAVEGGPAIMYILDNGTVISYDQVNQGDSQRTVFIDPASLTSSSGELGNLIFTFDESGGGQGTLLNITQPTEATETSEYTYTPAQRPSGSTTQDILAEALANTQVLQAEASATEMMLDSSSLSASTISPSSALYPNNVLTLSNNVLETSLTLNQPIMTPMEVPSAVSSLQPPPVATGSLELPVPIAQPDITISTSSYASLPIPSATIQGTVFSDATSGTYSTIVPVLSRTAGKRTFYVEAANPTGTPFGVTEFTCGEDVDASTSLVKDGVEGGTKAS